MISRRCELDALEALLAERLKESAELVGSMARAIPTMEGEDAEVRDLAVEVQVLSKELQEVVEAQERVGEARDLLAARYESLKDRYETVREQLEVGGGDRGMAQILPDMQRRFPAQVEFVTELGAQVAPLDATRLASLQIRVKLRGQAELGHQFAGHPSAIAAQLVADRQDLLERLRTQYRNLLRDLALLEGERRQYLNQARKVAAYASGQLFGFAMRSLPPMSIQTLAVVPTGLQWLFRIEHWREV